MQNVALKISIPEVLEFSALQLAREADGHVSFDWAPIEAICEASGIDAEIYKNSHEDNVAGLIVGWYQAHIANGGERDAVADDLINEAEIEDQHGGGFSLPLGRA